MIPSVVAHCWGSLVLEVTFGSPDNFRRENLLFNIGPVSSDYQALLGRPAFACFNAIPNYAYLKLKMPGPRGVITVNRNAERSSRTEESATTLEAGSKRPPTPKNMNGR